MESKAYLLDCMEGMKQFPDKHFELAIVDPPYGIIASNGRSMKNLLLHEKYENKMWFNEKPTTEYFQQLFRVSNNQIIWGGNYFDLPIFRCPIIWDKIDYNSDFAAGEMAWSSFDKPMRIFRYARHAAGAGNRIHPTQKPVELYRWLLHKYAKPGDKILDTHLGSGSSRIAAYEMGFDFVGFEIDADYFAAQEKRFKEYASQTRLPLTA